MIKHLSHIQLKLAMIEKKAHMSQDGYYKGMNFSSLQYLMHRKLKYQSIGLFESIVVFFFFFQKIIAKNFTLIYSLKC